MGKFWRWMENQEYGYVDPVNIIGFLMEYLDGVCPEWQKNGMSEKNDEDYWNFFELKTTTDERYDWLVAKINSLED